MSDYIKTQEDIDQEKSDLETDNILRFIKYRGDNHFKVGDVLIKMYRTWSDDQEWVTESVSSANPAPKKYLYAFENELGIGYLKTFKTDGKLSEAATCMTMFDYARTKFLLDPEYVDHILLSEDEEYDPIAAAKKNKQFRVQAINKNRKLALPRDSESVLKWLETLKPGQTFYYGYSVADMTTTKYKVIKTTNVKLSSMDTWNAERLMKKLGLRRTDSVKKIYVETVINSFGDSGDKVEFYADEFLERFITEKEVFPLKENT